MKTHQEHGEQGMQLVKRDVQSAALMSHLGEVTFLLKKQAALIDASKNSDPKPRRLSDLRWEKQS